MKVRDVMTAKPACATPDTVIQDVAGMMVEFDCGEIPVCIEGKLVGVVTDRDITCRAVARQINPIDLPVRQVMSQGITTVSPEDSLEIAVHRMEDRQIRRIPVIQPDGTLVGIISLADIAERTSERQAGELVREVSHHGPVRTHFRITI